MSVKLTARWVLGFEGDRHVLREDSELVFSGGEIDQVGPRSDMAADQTIDLGNALIAPGFIDLNALADVDTTILGVGARPRPGAKAWSEAYADHPRDVLTPAEQVVSARAAFCQLLLSGVTTALPVTSLLFRRWAESGAEFDAIAALAGELGIRLVLGPSFRSAVNVIADHGAATQQVDDRAGLDGLDDAIAFIERNHGGQDGLVSGLLVPSTIDTCSDELIQRTAEAAERLGVPFRLHCCQSKAEAELIWRRSGKTSIAHLAALGVLSQRALLPHAIDLGGPDADPTLAARDRQALADSAAVVVHCPLVSGRGGRRLETFASFRDQGIRIGLGTDTAPPNMLMNLQTGLWLARLGDPQGVGPADYLCAATLGGSDAIARPDLGRLAKGAAADLVVWDLDALDMQPVHDPVEALFLMPPGLRPRHVWVAGRQSVRDGKVVGVDERGLARSMQEIFEALRDSFAERNREGAAWPTLFPAVFPTERTIKTKNKGEHS